MGGIDPQRLATFEAVVAEAMSLPPEHPDAVAVRRATAALYKAVKVERRRIARDEVQTNDRAVDALTATAAPGRIDDETVGAALASTALGPSAGTLRKARSCYVCKQRFTEVHAFYHQLCPPCAALNWARREARTDLTGRRALLTGGRAKIGMHIALRLLRDGARTTITTRFPADAARRFAALPDSADWIDRLRIVGVDLRDPAQVVALADTVAADGPLDVLVNNAAQTVKRAPGSYRHLVAAEQVSLDLERAPDVVSLERFRSQGVRALTGALTEAELVAGAVDPQQLAELALTAGSASLERVAAGSAIDAGGLVPDLADVNSWTQHVQHVDPLELLEVQLCNSVAPFLLVSRLRPSMASSAARRKHVVNVSAMEGQFTRGYKSPGHPHTNMAKAALNMLTRTSAKEMLQTDGILMTAVDTGWITDERPHPLKARLHEEGFRAPLDLADGAARVYDPIVRGEAGEDVYGVFLKDYVASPW